MRRRTLCAALLALPLARCVPPSRPALAAASTRSGSAYAADFQAVQTALDELPAEPLTMDLLRQEIGANTRALVAGLERLRAEVAALRRETTLHSHHPRGIAS